MSMVPEEISVQIIQELLVTSIWSVHAKIQWTFQV